MGAGAGRGGRQGASDAEIGRRLGVAHTTISRRLGPREQARRRAGRQEPLFTGHGAGHLGPVREPPGAEAAGSRSQQSRPAAGQEPGAGARGPGRRAPGRGARHGRGAGPGTRDGVLVSRYAGAMLLHAFCARADAGGGADPPGAGGDAARTRRC